MANDYPIVFVHGLLGWGRDKLLGLPYFGSAPVGMALGRLLALNLGGRSGALFPSVGPISSNHDRACELFYALKGGAIQYGQAHAEAHSHRASVQARTDALLPDWDAEHPVHFVGQAQGASTVRLLQHLLSLGDFFIDASTGRPYHTDASWVHSITSISGIHNGTPTAYIAGCSLEDGRVQRYSTVEYLARTLLDLDDEARSSEPTFQQFFYALDLEQWPDKAEFLRGTDNAIYDLSIHGAQAMDYVQDSASTYYFSYVTSLSAPSTDAGHHAPQPGMAVAFRYPSTEIGRFAGPLANLRYPIVDFASWWENDGLAPVITQECPRWGTPRIPILKSVGEPLRKGVWYMMGRLAMDHMNPVAAPRLSWTFEQQRELVSFYRGIYELVSGLDAR
jgi:triacylglycerol lipase